MNIGMDATVGSRAVWRNRISGLGGQGPYGGRCGPGDVVRLVRWAAPDEGAWTTGQVIDSEGGLRHCVM
ncbi:hypothetical protein GCM10029978_081610 [Actinoallomurus acanthiterrae]